MNDATKEPGKKPARAKKPVDDRPFHVYAEVSGQIALEDIKAPTAEVALELAKIPRDKLAKKMEALKLGTPGNTSLHVRELHVTRFGKDEAYDPPREPDPSPAMQLYLTLMRGRSKAVRQSDRRSNPVRNAVVSLAIAAGLRFDKDDLDGSDGICTGWGHYKQAISEGNTSFCQAHEAREGRPPFFFDGRIYIGKILEWPRGGWGEKSAPWPDNAPESWDGTRIEVTNFGKEKDGTPYLLAVSRRREGQVERHPAWGDEVRASARQKIKHRHKIPIDDMRFFEKARAEGAQLDAWMREIMPQLRNWEIAIREDVLRAAPKAIRAEVKEWTAAYWNRDRPIACINDLVLESTRVAAFEPDCTELSNHCLNIRRITIASWTPEQLAAVKVWAASDDYKRHDAIADVLTADHERARAVIASLDVIEALRVGATDRTFEEWKEPVVPAAWPRLAAEMNPVELELLFGFARKYAASDDKKGAITLILATDDGKRIRAIVREIANSARYETERATKKDDDEAAPDEAEEPAEDTADEAEA